MIVSLMVFSVRKKAYLCGDMMIRCVRHIASIVMAIAVCVTLKAQSGNGTYAYLDVSPSSRIAALGGLNISSIDNDITSAIHNPALLTAETHNTISLNYASYIAGINFLSAAYGYNYNDNYFAAAINYVDYGRFRGADEVGVETGSFTAKDFCFNLIYARRINDYFTAGATLKPLYSVYERYTSFALAVDIGATFCTLNKLFSAAIAFRNAGVQLKGFHDDEDGKQYRDRVPFEIDLGITGKFKHAPLRLSLTLHNLQRWDLSYQVTNQTVNTLNGGTQAKSADVGWFDMLFRHAIIALDIMPSNNFYATIAYNHRRNAEMRAEGYRSLGGFSFGAGVRLYKFHIGFGAEQYMKGNFAFHFSLTTHINDFKK